VAGRYGRATAGRGGAGDGASRSASTAGRFGHGAARSGIDGYRPLGVALLAGRPGRPSR
jgi:hypothetical protein